MFIVIYTSCVELMQQHGDGVEGPRFQGKYIKLEHVSKYCHADFLLGGHYGSYEEKSNCLWTLSHLITWISLAVIAVFSPLPKHP